MKKIFTILAIVVPALIVSCTKETSEVVETHKVDFNALSIDSKAVFGTISGSTYPVTWSSNDVAPAVNLNFSSSFSQAKNFTITSDGTKARFTAEVPSGETEYQFLAVSPYSNLKSVNSTEKKINVEIPSGQTPSATSPDESAIVLCGVSSTYTELPTSVDMTFSHVTAYLHLFFTNLGVAAGETVQSVGITSDKYIAGRMFFVPSTGEISANSMVKSITVNTTDPSEVWVGLAPEDLSGETLAFTITSDQKVYSKSITLPSSRALSPGKIAKITIDMSDATATTPVEYKLIKAADEVSTNDEIIIVAAKDEYAMSTAQNSNNRGYTGITKDGESIWSPGDAVQRITLVDGLVPGEYALKVGDGQYLNYVTGGNYLRTGTSITAQASWDISVANITSDDRGTGYISYIQDKTDGRYIRFNSSLFSAYVESSGTSFVQIYRKVQTPDASFNVTLPEGTDVTYAAQTIPVYVFGNVDWTASVTGGATLDKTSGTGASVLSLSIPANTDKTNTVSYKVTVTTTASVSTQSYELTITQGKAPGILAVGDILFYENWGGKTTGDVLKYVVPSAYQSTEYANTVVYGGATVTYTEYKGGSNTRLYEDGTVYGSTTAPSSNNLMIGYGNGYWKISGIPCKGVKTARLTYCINRSQLDYTASSDTDGVTFGTISSDDATSEYNSSKLVYTITYTVTFDSEKALETFDMQLTNTNSSLNIRVTDIKLVVTELQ